uniref:NADH-ubiquinone oxidoreductase chain 5 n=1 Tax=Hyalella neveulemairei TaxID=2759783 RepID=A0A7T8V718_9CRUS|nr:NADH dehydrogenase subunit 5 [Hyalella neveulemairei]
MNLMNNIYKIFCLLNSAIMVTLLVMAMTLIYQETTIILDWQIMGMNSSSITMSVLIDWMALIFLSTVMLITASICLFSAYYMKGDTNKTRFMLLLMLFVASMVCLIISPNMVSILLGWDGLGLTSYVLVIYYQNESSCNAGMLTILSNRIGDVCILMSIAILSYAGSWNFFCMDEVQYKVIYCLIVVAGMTKSAQIPFSAWLPAAMAAPTPVSALVHSSTLVTAGVYLIIRFFHILENSVFLQILLVISVMTMLMAGWGANFEVDLKKIVALSTLSQLGLMMMILSLGMKNVAFFHMISHAMFKSTLFMSAGVMIHMSNSAQDTRLMGSMGGSSPTLMTMFSIMNMSLLGFPFLSGFFSKDLSLDITISSLYNMFVLTLVVIATGMTVSYSLRVIYLAITNSTNNKSAYTLEDSDSTVITSMLILFFMGVLMGYLFSWLVVWTPYALVMTSLNKYYILCVMFISGAIILLTLTYKAHMSPGLSLTLFLASSSKMWNLPFLTTNSPVKLALMTGLTSSQLMDKGWLETYPPKSMFNTISFYSAIIQKTQTTVMISAYLVTFSLLAVLILLYY